MKKILILFVLILAGCKELPTQPPISETSSDEVLPIAVCLRVDYNLKYEDGKVKMSNDWGSGFFVEKNNNIYLVTALHNIENLKNGFMYIINGSHSIKIADRNTLMFTVNTGDVDYVAIPIKNLPVRPYILKVGKAKTYDEISVYGYPGDKGELVKTSGTIKCLVIHTNAPIYIGHSGSPCINSEMEVVGVATNSVLRNNEVVGGLGTAISDFYDELP